VITASVKPAVLLVWVGLIVGVIGGMIAFVRRYKEGQAHLSGQRVRLPRGVPGLSGLPGKMGWRGGSAARR
jgi:cytochrome c-type biogenesis protein CcmF